METKFIKNTSSLLFVIILFSACGPVAKIPGTDTKITGTFAGIQLQPPEGKALIYIIRSSTVGSAMKMKVKIDEQVIGFTKGKKFLYAFVDPGKHQVSGISENYTDVPIIIKSGMTYYFEQKPSTGLFRPRNKLRRVDEKSGKRKLAKCKLSRTNYTLEGF